MDTLCNLPTQTTAVPSAYASKKRALAEMMASEEPIPRQRKFALMVQSETSHSESPPSTQAFCDDALMNQLVTADLIAARNTPLFVPSLLCSPEIREPRAALEPVGRPGRTKRTTRKRSKWKRSSTDSMRPSATTATNQPPVSAVDSELSGTSLSPSSTLSTPSAAECTESASSRSARERYNERKRRVYAQTQAIVYRDEANVPQKPPGQADVRRRCVEVFRLSEDEFYRFGDISQRQRLCGESTCVDPVYGRHLCKRHYEIARRVLTKRSNRMI